MTDVDVIEVTARITARPEAVFPLFHRARTLLPVDG
jgi:hypothetical protein